MMSMSTGTERPASAEGGATMMNLINTTTTANLSVILAEDTGAPELRNPKLSGISKARMNLLSRLFKGMAARK